MDEELNRLIEWARTGGFTLSIAALAQSAEQRTIPWMTLGEPNLIQLGHGRYQKLIYGTITSNTSRAAIKVAADKSQTNRLLSALGLPVPRQRVVHQAEQVVRASETIGCPVVIKPMDWAHGQGIFVRPVTAVELLNAFFTARKYSRAVVVEEYIRGFDYRMLVVNRELVAVARRVPAHVVGDGCQTIAALVEQTNRDSRRGRAHENILTRLELDDEAQRLLARRSYMVDTVPPTGDIIHLRETANLSAGGTAAECTDIVHPENGQMALRAVEAVGLDVGGVDFITPDISRPYGDVGGAICEVNASPGLRMHLAPSEGARRDVAGPIIDMLFPPGIPSRIPIVRISGAADEGITSYLLAHIMRVVGYVVGLSTADGIFIDGQCIGKATKGRDACLLILRDTTIDAAIFATTVEDLLAPRLSYGRPNVAAYLDMTTAGSRPFVINRTDSDAEFEQLILNDATDVSVLNADLPWSAGMAAHCPANRICYVSTRRSDASVNQHIRAGGAAVVLEEQATVKRIKLYGHGCEYASLSTHQIPITRKGRALHRVRSAMFATASAHSLGIGAEEIAYGLRTFTGR